MLDTAERLPWAGHSAHHAHRRNLRPDQAPQDHARLRQHPQPGREHLPGAVAHQRRRRSRSRCITARSTWRSAARSRPRWRSGRLRAVVSTSSLDLGVDWGDVDLVINVGAPKGASRLLQRIGRANHRMDEPSRGVLIPANRFEVLECTAALGAIAENAQDTPAARIGALDVLAQHVLGSACGEPFLADELYAEVTSAAPYAGLTRADFDAVLDFVATGGYALKAYERFAKIRQGKDGPLARQQSDDRAALPHECRHHRRGRHAQGAAGALARLEDDPARRPAPRRGRGIFHRDAHAGRHLRVRRRNPALRGDGRRTRSMSRAPPPRTPRCRPTRAASFRSRPISPTACARSSPITTNGGRCPLRCANGSKSRNGARWCRGRASCWSRPFRAPTSTTSSAIRSRAGSRTRRSACC